MTPRAFTFAALLVATAQPALAGGDEAAPYGIAEAQSQLANPAPEAAPAPAAQPLEARWKTSIQKGVLVAQLTLVNTSGAPVDVIVARGSGNGAYVNATVGGTQLSEILTEKQQSAMWSRVGPVPTWAAVAKNGTVSGGTFRFTLPEGYNGEAVEVATSVVTRGADKSVKSVQMTARLMAAAGV